MWEIFDKNRYNGQVGNCNVSVGRYKNAYTVVNWFSGKLVKLVPTSKETEEKGRRGREGERKGKGDSGGQGGEGKGERRGGLLL